MRNFTKGYHVRLLVYKKKWECHLVQTNNKKTLIFGQKWLIQAIVVQWVQWSEVHCKKFDDSFFFPFLFGNWL